MPEATNESNRANGDARVTFFGIGAARAGTTWLAHNLALHPDVYLPPEKEVGYFNRYTQEDDSIESFYYKRPLAWYHGFFKDAASHQRVGEINPAYLTNLNCAADIHAYNPEARIIAILRDPVQRAFANYQMYRQRGIVKANTFAEAVKEKDQFLRESQYGRLLTPYFDTFPREQVAVMFTEDLRADAVGLYNTILAFLGLSSYHPDGVDDRKNETREPGIPFINTIISSTKRFLNQRRGLHFLLPVLQATGITAVAQFVLSKNSRAMTQRPDIPEALDAELRATFVPDIEIVERLTGRDLSVWKARGG